MKRLVALMMCAVSFGAVAQSTITYPYNPDGNADGDIAVGDLQDFLVTYGNPFSPSEIMVGDSSLTYWVESINESLNGIDSRDLTFPNGLANAESIIHDVYNHGEFVVPEGKQLYFMGLRGDSPGSLTINGLAFDNYNSDQLVCPLILSAGTVISCEDAVPPHRVILRGFLADGIVEPMLLGSGDFVVPDEQMLVISFLKLYGSSFEVNGHLLYESGTYFLRSPLVLTAGDSIAFVGGETQRLVTGYLAPLTFFDQPVSESEEDSDGPCQGEFTVNYHGYDYELVEIGDQCWFAENLQTVQYNNGDSIPYEILGQTGFDFQQDPSRYDDFCVYGPYVGSAGIKSSVMRPWMGLAYSGYAALQENLCPVGFRVPKTEDFESLLGAPVNVHVDRADLLDTPPWSFGTNLSGFSIRMHGSARHNDCDDPGQKAFLLASDIAGYQGDVPYMIRLEVDLDGTAKISDGNSFIAWSHGGAIRCIKDAE